MDMSFSSFVLVLSDLAERYSYSAVGLLFAYVYEYVYAYEYVPDA